MSVRSYAIHITGVELTKKERAKVFSKLEKNEKYKTLFKIPYDPEDGDIWYEDILPILKKETGVKFYYYNNEEFSGTFYYGVEYGKETPEVLKLITEVFGKKPNNILEVLHY